METAQSELAAKYLLGKLTDEDKAVVEAGYFQDNGLFENMLIVENSLIDAYVTGGLSHEDRRLFETRLLISPRQRQRAAFAETFVNYASSIPNEETVSPTFIRPLLTGFARMFSFRPLLSFSLAAAALIFAVIGVYMWAPYGSSRFGDEDLALSRAPAEVLTDDRSSSRQAEVQAPANEDNKAGSSVEKMANVDATARSVRSSNGKPAVRTSNPPAIISTFILSVGSTRGSEPGNVFIIPAETGLVRLKLQFETGSFQSYFAVVETADGQHVWSGKVPRLNVSNDEATATLTVPAKRLSRGDYTITLKGLTKSGIYESIADYSFTVERR